ncbi:13026_t:CDS:1, partial [Dentiscutata erythropus]
ISHAINRHVHLGFNIAQGSDIELAIEGIRGTSVAHLEPKRPK